MEDKELRLSLYRKIEVARKQLPKMDDVAFRAMLLFEFGVESRKDMSVRQLARLVELFARYYGVEYAPKKKKSGVSNFMEITDSMPFAREKRQILAIWRKLGYSLSSLDTRVRRAFNVPFFMWLSDSGQIRALLSDLQRREKSFNNKKKGKAAANA